MIIHKLCFDQLIPSAHRKKGFVFVKQGAKGQEKNNHTAAVHNK